jgi:hypothetical protein
MAILFFTPDRRVARFRPSLAMTWTGASDWLYSIVNLHNPRANRPRTACADPSELRRRGVRLCRLLDRLILKAQFVKIEKWKKITLISPLTRESAVIAQGFIALSRKGRGRRISACFSSEYGSEETSAPKGGFYARDRCSAGFPSPARSEENPVVE